MSGTSKTLSILAGLFLTTAFCVSLFFHGGYDIQYAPAFVCLLIVACLTVMPSLLSKIPGHDIRVPSGLSALLLFLLWIYLMSSMFWSTVPYISLVTFLVLSSLPLVFFSFTLAPQPELFIKPAFYMILTGLGVLAVYALFQSLTGLGEYNASTFSRAHLPLSNPNSLAGLLNFGFLMALAWCFKDKEGRYKAFALTALMFAGILATGSRGALIAGFIATLFILFQFRSKRKQVALVALGIVTALAVYAVVFGGRHIFANNMLEGRMVIWGSALQLAKDHLLTGTGLGTFYLYYPPYRVPLLDTSAGQWAHMDTLQLWIETGIAAPILLYAITGAFFLRMVKTLGKVTAENKVYIVGSAAGLLAFFIHSHVTFHFYVMPLMIVAGVWLVLNYTLSARELNDNSFHKVSIENWQRSFMAVVLVCVVAAMMTMTASAAIGPYYIQKAQNHILSRDTDKFIKDIESAEKWAPRSFADPKVQLVGLYIDMLRDAQTVFEPEVRQEMFEQGLVALQVAETLNPVWAEVDYKRAQLYMVAGDDVVTNADNKIMTSLENAIAKNPMHFQARIKLADFLIQKGRVARAYELLTEGLKYPHDGVVRGVYMAMINRLEPLVRIRREYIKEQGKS